MNQGYLKKKSPKTFLGLENWQERFFVLEADKFLYYVRHKHHARAAPSGRVLQTRSAKCRNAPPSLALRTLEPMLQQAMDPPPTDVLRCLRLCCSRRFSCACRNLIALAAWVRARPAWFPSRRSAL